MWLVISARIVLHAEPRGRNLMATLQPDLSFRLDESGEDFISFQFG